MNDKQYTYSLKDSDDDVRAVAASILIPIADYFVTNSSHKIPELVIVLWDCLKDLKDDLTASTASVMDLLGKYVVDLFIISQI